MESLLECISGNQSKLVKQEIHHAETGLVEATDMFFSDQFKGKSRVNQGVIQEENKDRRHLTLAFCPALLEQPGTWGREKVKFSHCEV